MEAWEGSAQHRLWVKCRKESSVSNFIELLGKATDRIVFTWGFPPDTCIPIVRQFVACGVDFWWFDGDEVAARTAKMGRDKIACDFDLQMAKIKRHRAELSELYGGNMIRTLEGTGDYLGFDRIAEAIGLHPYP